jgi:hypothetical protein
MARVSYPRVAAISVKKPMFAPICDECRNTDVVLEAYISTQSQISSQAARRNGCRTAARTHINDEGATGHRHVRMYDRESAFHEFALIRCPNTFFVNVSGHLRVLLSIKRAQPKRDLSFRFILPVAVGRIP